MPKRPAKRPAPEKPKLGLLEDFLVEGEVESPEPELPADAPADTAILAISESTEHADYNIAQGSAYFLDLEQGLYALSWPLPSSPDATTPFETTVIVLPVDEPTGPRAPVTVKRAGAFTFVKILANKSRLVVMAPQANDPAESALKLTRLDKPPTQ